MNDTIYWQHKKMQRDYLTNLPSQFAWRALDGNDHGSERNGRSK
jgi:hypothetical protein